MRIGILGVGSIGRTLVRRLSSAGHDVKAANSRGPDTIDSDVFTSGGRAVTIKDAVADVDIIILSIPLTAIPDTAPLLADVPGDVVVIDTSNYIPARDESIPSIEEGQVESLWVTEKLGRPIVKAWNSIGAESFAAGATSAGEANRIALPVAADSERAKRIGMTLVEDTGFDAVDSGPIADSWRQQPGSPAYCTDLTRDELMPAMRTADKARIPRRRDIAMLAVEERIERGTQPDRKFLTNLSRALYS